MIRRAGVADHEAIKALCNDPAVRGRMSDTVTEIDPLGWLQEPRNVVLFDGENAALFLWRWIGIYEVHVLFRCRGRKAVALGREMLTLMFNSGAGMILCVVNFRLPEAAWFARRMGFTSRGLIQTIEGASEMFQLESQQWA
jgi:hypothetical protein